LIVITYITNLLTTGLGSLAAYLAAHVILCLLPAFFIAGALTALIPKETITKYLGKNASKWVSYPASAISGFVLAVCSCTIMPLFAGIYKKGAGIGPAMTFLFVGPAVNILAISFTGVQIGMDIAIARIVLALIFGIGIGLFMALLFSKDDKAHHEATNNSDLFSKSAKIPLRIWILLVLLLSILIAGTLQVNFLKKSYVDVILPISGINNLQDVLNRLVPPNPALGIESISFHGLILIGLLTLFAIAALLGFNKIDTGFNFLTYVALGLITLTLIFASINLIAAPTGLMLGFTGKFFAETILLASLWLLMARYFKTNEIQGWLWETWRFVQQIIPLLIAGVFVAGMARAAIPAIWISTLAGKNTFWANLAGVLFGVFMYFPTLVEVPIAQTFLSLGMHRGPLLAYLLADPELSLQSILITNTVIGKKKTAVYVVLVTIFSTLSGLLFGWLIS